MRAIDPDLERSRANRPGERGEAADVTSAFFMREDELDCMLAIFNLAILLASRRESLPTKSPGWRKGKEDFSKGRLSGGKLKVGAIAEAVEFGIPTATDAFNN